jgi:hypothetical protein
MSQSYSATDSLSVLALNTPPPYTVGGAPRPDCVKQNVPWGLGWRVKSNYMLSRTSHRTQPVSINWPVSWCGLGKQSLKSALFWDITLRIFVVADVSRQSTCPILKGQAVLPLEVVPKRRQLSTNPRREVCFTSRWKPKITQTNRCLLRAAYTTHNCT